MTMKPKLKKILRNHGPRFKFNLDRLKDPKVSDLFEATIGGIFAALNLLEENIDNLPEYVHGALVDTASEVLGKARRKKKPWITNDILDLCARRKKPQVKRKRWSIGNVELL